MGLGNTQRLLRAQELRKTHFSTCSSFGVNLGLRRIYHCPAHASPRQKFGFGRFGSDLGHVRL